MGCFKILWGALGLCMVGGFFLLVTGLGFDQFRYYPDPSLLDPISTTTSSTNSSSVSANLQLRPRPPNGVLPFKVNGFARGCVDVNLFTSWACWEDRSNSDRSKRAPGLSVADWDAGPGCERYPAFLRTSSAFSIISVIGAAVILFLGTTYANEKRENSKDDKSQFLTMLQVTYVIQTVCIWLAFGFAAPMCTATLCTEPGSKPLSETGTCERSAGLVFLAVSAGFTTTGLILSFLLTCFVPDPDTQRNGRDSVADAGGGGIANNNNAGTDTQPSSWTYEQKGDDNSQQQDSSTTQEQRDIDMVMQLSRPPGVRTITQRAFEWEEDPQEDVLENVPEQFESSKESDLNSVG